MRPALFVILAASIWTVPGIPVQGQPGPQQPYALPAPSAPRDGLHDFHALQGTWRIHDIRLRRPLTGRREIEHLYGTAIVRGIGDGRVSVERLEATRADSTVVREVIVMRYDSLARQWSLRRADSAGRALGPAMTGEFRNGTGEFYGQQRHNGRIILTRLTWTLRVGNHARFERAYSADGGRTWELNRTVSYERAGHAPNANDRRLPDISSFLRGPARRRVIAPVPLIITCCPALDAVRYRVAPEKQDALVAIFDGAVAAGGDSTERREVALFRDIDEAGVFVWLRGSSFSTSAAALNSFYRSQSWSALREPIERNSSVMDVRLLTPALGGDLLLGERPAPSAPGRPGILVVTRYTLDTTATRKVSMFQLHDFFVERMAPRLYAAGMRPIAAFQTHHESREPFVYTEGIGWHTTALPGLPMRMQTLEFVWFARFPDVAAYDRAVAALNRDPRWTDYQEILSELLVGPPEVWRLQPVGRSAPFR